MIDIKTYNVNKDAASFQQKRMFFALGHQLKYDPDTLKERAKKKFNLTSFNFITKTQLSQLIDLLLNQIETRKEEQNATT